MTLGFDFLIYLIKCCIDTLLLHCGKTYQYIKAEKYQKENLSYCCKEVQFEEDNSLQLFAVWDFLTITEAETKRKY